MAEPHTLPGADPTPAIKVGDIVLVAGQVTAEAPGDPPEIKDGLQIRFDSTIPGGARVTTVAREIVRRAPERS